MDGIYLDNEYTLMSLTCKENISPRCDLITAFAGKFQGRSSPFDWFKNSSTRMKCGFKLSAMLFKKCVLLRNQNKYLELIYSNKTDYFYLRKNSTCNALWHFKDKQIVHCATGRYLEAFELMAFESKVRTVALDKNSIKQLSKQTNRSLNWFQYKIIKHTTDYYK